jgi:hypothetical protein
VDEVTQQIANGFANTSKRKRVINVDKLKSSLTGDEKNTTDRPSSSKPFTPRETPSSTSGAFSVDDITLGERYEGYVKLIYNYGIFVTVKGVE